MKAIGRAMPFVALTPPQAVPMMGGFDYVTVDAPRRRVYAAHTGAQALLVVDADTGKVLAQIHVGPLHGVAVDPATGHVYTGDGTANSISEVDPVAGHVLRSTPVAGPVDAVAYDPSSHHVYGDEDDGTRVFVVDATTMRSVGTVALPGHKPESLAVDPASHAVYQNIADLAEVAVIDPTTLTVISVFKTPELVGNHPLQFDARTGLVVVGGTNGMLGSYTAAGKTVGTTPMQAHVDQCSLDLAGTLACAGNAAISVFSVAAGAAPVRQGMIDVPTGTHTVGIDSANGRIWAVWAAGGSAFVQGFDRSR